MLMNRVRVSAVPMTPRGSRIVLLPVVLAWETSPCVYDEITVVDACVVLLLEDELEDEELEALAEEPDVLDNPLEDEPPVPVVEPVPPVPEELLAAAAC